MAPCRSGKGPWLDIRSGILILGLPPCRAMRNTYFISLPFSDTLQPWTTMTWAASCPLSFISPKGDQASFQLRLLVMPQNYEGVQYIWETKEHSIPWPAPGKRDYYEPNLNTLEISFAMRITRGGTHKETTITVSSWKQKSCAMRNTQTRAFQTSCTAQPATDGAYCKRCNRNEEGCPPEF